jgi:hypothetical protein
MIAINDLVSSADLTNVAGGLRPVSAHLGRKMEIPLVASIGINFAESIALNANFSVEDRLRITFPGFPAATR